jgi:hypothetical protein
VEPQRPFVGVGGVMGLVIEQEAVVPPFEPRQFQRYEDVLSAMSCNVPVVQMF